ncbi:MAG: hypothetical protein ACRBCK_09535 [Alphaproteobacteria bacterium]
MTNNETLQNKTPIKLMLVTTGFAFLCMSALLLIEPQIITEHIDLDNENAQIFGLAAGIIGVSDIIIALFVFRKRETR